MMILDSGLLFGPLCICTQMGLCSA